MSQNRKIRSVAGIVALLGAVATLITASLGSGGLPGLIGVLHGQPPKLVQSPAPSTPPTPSQDTHNSDSETENSAETSNDRLGSLNIGASGTSKNTISGSGNIVGAIQQSRDGDCSNVQITGQGNTFICHISRSGRSSIEVPLKLSENALGSDSNLSGGNSITAPNKFRATIQGLKNGSRNFRLWLDNMTSDQSISFLSNIGIKITDDKGNYYDTRLPLEKDSSPVIPPKRYIRIDYALNEPIAKNASILVITLDAISARPLTSPYSENLPPIQWNLKL